MEAAIVVTPNVTAAVEVLPAPSVSITVGLQGPPGPAGPGGSQTSTLVAATAIGGQRLVTTNAAGRAIYADSSDISHAGRVVGISTGAVNAGEIVTIQSAGPLTDAAFNWTAGALLYLGATGLLTQTAPTTGFSQCVGYAETATTIFIRLTSAIILE